MLTLLLPQSPLVSTLPNERPKTGPHILCAGAPSFRLHVQGILCKWLSLSKGLGSPQPCLCHHENELGYLIPAGPESLHMAI